MSIDVLGDRRNSGYCLRCGTLLMITPWNEYQCCVACTEIIETVAKRELTKKPKKDGGGRMVILKPSIFRQLRPLKEDYE